MTKRSFTLITLLLAVLKTTGGSASDAKTSPPVFVLAVANTESFDPTLGDLRFSKDDGQRFGGVMTKAGGVSPNHMITVNNASLSEFRQAVAGVAAVAKASGAKKGTKLVLYFTGHSDVTGIHMTDGLLRREELHQLIASVPVETRVAILDSCYSGALTEKGIRAAEAFTVPVAELDEPTGSVYLAATSSSDLAFEVDELGGSLFTHHLVAGLYGQADGNDDGLVTVDEAYQYVYQQMHLQAAAMPTPSKQKPEYSTRLKGQGALVLAFVKDSSVPVTFDRAIEGEITLAADKGLRLFRINKKDGEEKRLLMVPGEYQVVVKTDRLIGRGDLHVALGSTVTLKQSDLVFTEPSQAVTKAKGRATGVSFEIEAGTHTSSFGLIGPSMEARALTPRVRLGTVTYRALAQLGGHTNALDYKGQTGTSQSASGQVGGTGSIFFDDAFEGQQLFVLAAVGADYVRQNWNDGERPVDRQFDPSIPKIALGIGTLVPTDSGMMYGLSFRREWMFATNKATDDVYAFSASLLAFLVGF